MKPSGSKSSTDRVVQQEIGSIFARHESRKSFSQTVVALSQVEIDSQPKCIKMRFIDITGKKVLALTIPVLALLLVIPASAQQAVQEDPQEWAMAGQLFMQHYSTEDFRAENQNWAMVQDHQGIVYFGNGQGVIEFDGTRWRTIPTPNQNIVRSLDMDGNGRIYVGGYREIGYLAHDELGQKTYVSLLDQLPEKDQEFTDVWRTYVQSEGIYFQADQQLFRWDQDTMKVWKEEDSISDIFSLHDRLLIHYDTKEGLYELIDDVFVAIPNTEWIPYDSRLISTQENTIWVMASEQGIYRCSADFIECEAIENSLSHIIRNHRVYSQAIRPDGGWVLGTLGGGVILADGRGNLLRQITESDGLFSGYIASVYVDRMGDVWAAHEGGLTHIVADPSWSYFDHHTGLRSPPHSMIEFEKRIFSANVQGALRLESGENGRPALFTTMPGELFDCAGLVPSKNSLLVGCGPIIFRVDDTAASVAWEHDVFSWITHIIRSKSDSAFLIASMKGVALLREEVDGSITSLGFEESSDLIEGLMEKGNGIWFTSQSSVVKMHWPNGLDQPYAVNRYDTTHGLPNVLSFPILIDSTFYLSSSEGLYHPIYEAGQPDIVQRFERSLISRPPNSEPVESIASTPDGVAWALSDGVLGKIIREEDGKIVWQEHHRAWSGRAPQFASILDDALWLTVGQRIVRYVPEFNKPPDLPIRPVIRSFVDITRDSLIAGGAILRPVEIPYNNHALRFNYAGPIFGHQEALRFRTRLDGMDDDWSPWTSETHRDISNLSEGAYGFHVQLRDLHGTLSDTAFFNFRILPPWYRTWWAYLIWVSLAIATIFTVSYSYSRHHSKRLEERNQKLEQKVANRTAEIRAQKQLVEQQYHQLEEANETLELKQASLEAAYSEAQAINDELLRTNTSLEERTEQLRDALETNKEILGITAHDLKNPLGGIIGLAGMLIEDGEEGPEAAERSIGELAPMVKEEAERMLKIVTSLLDKHREGEDVVLNKEPALLNDFVATVMRWNQQQAAKKSISLHYNPCGVIPVNVDVVALQRVLDNYVSNAIKYSPRNSNVWISLSQLSENVAKVEVRDEGPGLTVEDKANVFGKMQRLSAKPTGGEHSTGLGLYIVKQLVEAHNGEVGVDSIAGEGAAFWFTLPISFTLKAEALIAES